MRKKYLFLLLTAFLLLGPVAYADIFTVTSNADSGPGTLREAVALAAANGTAVTDYIYFNMMDVSEAGRTIILQSELILPSRLIIDASTQPGLKFGVSDARIKIQHVGSQTFSHGFVISDVEEIEIYSLYMTNFIHGDPNLSDIRCAIYIPNKPKNLRIGAAGKGNVFFQNNAGIANRYFWTSNPGDRVTNITMQ